MNKWLITAIVVVAQIPAPVAPPGGEEAWAMIGGWFSWAWPKAAIAGIFLGAALWGWGGWQADERAARFGKRGVGGGLVVLLLGTIVLPAMLDVFAV